MVSNYFSKDKMCSHDDYHYMISRYETRFELSPHVMTIKCIGIWLLMHKKFLKPTNALEKIKKENKDTKTNARVHLKFKKGFPYLVYQIFEPI